VITHVNNFKVYAANRRIIDIVKQQIINLFLMKDLGLIKFYLGMKIDRNREMRIIQFTQIAAIDRILNETKLINCLFCQIPIKHNL
jgi:hypothetical protein